MANPFKEINWNPSSAEYRKFAVNLIMGFPGVALRLLVSGYLAGKGWNVPLALKVGGIGVGVGVIFPGLFEVSVCSPGFVFNDELIDLPAFFIFSSGRETGNPA